MSALKHSSQFDHQETAAAKSSLLLHTLCFLTTRSVITVFSDNMALIMKSGNEVKTNLMGDYFTLVGKPLLHSVLHSELQSILNRNYKDGSRMLCQYMKTIVDAVIKTDLFPSIASLQSKLGKLFLNNNTYNEFQ